MNVEDRETFSAAFQTARAVCRAFPFAREMCDEAKIDGFTHVAKGIGSWARKFGPAVVLVFYRPDGEMRMWLLLRTRMNEAHRIYTELNLRANYPLTEKTRQQYAAFCRDTHLELAPREHIDDVLSADRPRAQVN